MPLFIYVSQMVFTILRKLFSVSCMLYIMKKSFVAFYGTGSYHLTGLVHISEVSWDLIQDVRDVLSEGEEVRVKVIKIDR